MLLTRDAKLLRHNYLIKNQIYKVKSLLKNEQLLEVDFEHSFGNTGQLLVLSQVDFENFVIITFVNSMKQQIRCSFFIVCQSKLMLCLQCHLLENDNWLTAGN